jgi:predicted nucleic acid-binding protein
LNRLVVDASVAAKWYLPAHGETLVSQARAVIEAHAEGRVKCVVPDFFWAELGNIFWKAVNRGRWLQVHAIDALGQMRQWGLISVPAEGLLHSALSIAFASQRTVYDSLYIALAAELRTQMVTADERLANATAARFPVKWLGSFSIT